MGIKPSMNATLQTVEPGTTLVIAAGATLQHSGAPSALTFSVAAGSANVSEITVTVKDALGFTVPGVLQFDLWLSDAATGAGLTATTASGAVGAKSASGADISTYVAKKSLRVQTLAAGTYVLSITDTAKTGFFVAALAPNGSKAYVAPQLTTGSYG
jgi:hypothetical protein